MDTKGYFDWNKITGDDESIRSALEHINAPVMLAVLVHITGDLSLLHGEIQIDMDKAQDLQCGISEEHQEIVRQKAFEALKDFRDRGCPPPAPLDEQALREVLTFLTGQELDDEYIAFLIEESEFDTEDAYGLSGFDDIPEADRQGFHAVIVGAGMSGLLAGYRLKQAGIAFTIVERSAEVSGTWLDNQYPGCRVDNPSRVYEYSFARYDWPQYFCAQPVLRKYFNECATNFGLRPHIRFEHEVEGAELDEESGIWKVAIRDKHGVASEMEANAFICCVGQLNQPSYPDIEGFGTFDGPAFHTARWDSSQDLKGKRVAVIGTGASAMQTVPEIAKEAADVVVFQRTPPWIHPDEDYRASVPDGEHWLINHVPYYARWNHFLLFWLDGEGLHASVTKDEAWEYQDRSVSEANEALRNTMIDFIKKELDGHERLIDVSIPYHPPCGKRMLVDDGTWYRSLTRDNVHLITEPIECINAGGVLGKDGVQHDVDVVIYATGFHAGRFFWPMEIKGKGGRDIREHWGDDP
ncbi:MAG: NAD(P)-binding domain-containing protein, partial [Rhodospirillaceae bacterium]|nr:NAD(P)-binding domain-containing protein [Rhodospirillaceae bacterium]